MRFLNCVLGAEPRHARGRPGPARLTAELDHAGSGIAVDGSAEMLAIARDRLPTAAATGRLCAATPSRCSGRRRTIDLALAIRFVRRFAPDVRRRLYAEMRRTLAPTGALVIDAQNRAVSLPHRQRKGLDRYPVFDALYDRDELVGEIEAAGFRVCRMEGIVRHFAVQSRINRLRRHGLEAVARGVIGLLERLPSRAPSTWMLLAEVAS